MRWIAVPLTLFVIGMLALTLSVSTRAERFSRGQNIAPVFEGWRRHADGSVGMLFGYLNRNYEEAIELPIGPVNQFDPGSRIAGSRRIS